MKSNTEARGGGVGQQAGGRVKSLNLCRKGVSCGGTITTPPKIMNAGKFEVKEAPRQRQNERREGGGRNRGQIVVHSILFNCLIFSLILIEKTNEWTSIDHSLKASIDILSLASLAFEILRLKNEKIQCDEYDNFGCMEGCGRGRGRKERR